MVQSTTSPSPAQTSPAPGHTASGHPARTTGLPGLSQAASVIGRLLRHAHQVPDRPAIRFEGTITTWAEHCEAVLRTAADLRARGIGPGDRVAVLLTNRPEFLTVTQATVALGAIIVPVNFRLSAGEVAYILGHSSPRILVSEPKTHELALGAVAQLNGDASSDAHDSAPSDAHDPAHSGTDDAEHGEAASGTADSAPTVLDCEGWLPGVIAHGPALDADDLPVPDAGDDYAILYTSGTTGRPKGAVLTHLNMYSGGMQSGARWQADETRTIMLAPPLFHVGSFMGMHSALVAGAASLVIPSAGFDAATTLQTMRDNDVTTAFMVPQQWHLICDEIERTGNEGLTLALANWGGAPATPKLLQRMAACLPNAQINAVFGQTETSATTVTLRFDDALRKLGSVGKPTPETWIRIVDADMNDVGVDEVGEIVYRGTCVMDRYWNDEAATAEAFAGGWFHSGDLVRRDAEGFLYVVDRLKDMIISCGENIYCAEVENALSWHPAVAEVTIVGRPDDKWGEVPVACIVPAPGAATPTLQDLRDFLDDKLARYKHPKDVLVLDALPRTGMGKIHKSALRQTV